ncbi:hypothetical protein RISK_005933 [Rhodopirellula islandica]|uniref:Uncharacterized protein n=1 Tax=Rhodopirellula islandica TaxID=595434 RepID=A0A0J1B5U8_RHOIS|nr:hypothetical protein RISK_005933 [Rhodopirellula islandica]
MASHNRIRFHGPPRFVAIGLVSSRLGRTRACGARPVLLRGAILSLRLAWNGSGAAGCERRRGMWRTVSGSSSRGSGRSRTRGNRGGGASGGGDGTGCDCLVG